MSIREKEELLRRSAQGWEDTAQEYKKAGEHRKAAEALRNVLGTGKKPKRYTPSDTSMRSQDGLWKSEPRNSGTIREDKRLKITKRILTSSKTTIKPNRS